MKEKIQKYLAGEREGFSLVELIIVIAIMAILIGVIALAVIPNIQRSRESKDLTTLDNILSSVNIAIANNQITGAGNFTYGSASSATGDGKTVGEAVEAELGTITLGSSAAGTADIIVSWPALTPGSTPAITVQVGETAAECNYTEGTPSGTNGKRLLKVTSKE